MMLAPLWNKPWLCEECSLEGKVALADYIFKPEEESLQGPLMGDPDFWPSQERGWGALCHEHYLQLPANSGLDYVPVAEGVPFAL